MKNLSILVCSTDKYHSLWNLQLDRFDREWPENKYKFYLGSDSKDTERVKVLRAQNGSDHMSWSACLISWLEQIDTKYVLLTLDDFILRKTVENEHIEDALSFLKDNDGDCLRLVSRPRPYYRIPETIYGQYDESMPCFVSAQASIWEKETLLKLLSPSESIWEFEKNGSARARQLGNFSCFGVYKTIYNYGEHILDGGKLLRTSVFNLPLSKYNLEFGYNSLSDECIILFKRFLHFLVHRQPLKIRLSLTRLASKQDSNTVQMKSKNDNARLPV